MRLAAGLPLKVLFAKKSACSPVPLPVAVGLCHRARDRDQPFRDGPFGREPELRDELTERFVRDEDVAVRIRQADAVKRRGPQSLKDESALIILRSAPLSAGRRDQKSQAR